VLGALCAVNALGAKARDDVRQDAIRQAQVWMPVDVATMDLLTGPADESGAFPFRAIVDCRYVPKKMNGSTPKFTCRVGEDDDLKVKYGGTNGEVYGEVLSTRLLWALGFGADRMYPVSLRRSVPDHQRPGRDLRARQPVQPGAAGQRRPEGMAGDACVERRDGLCR
jgi:hypothetical protein